MTPPQHVISVERIGHFVQLVVGPTTVRMTVAEAEVMVQAIGRAIDPPPASLHKATVH